MDARGSLGLFVAAVGVLVVAFHGPLGRVIHGVLIGIAHAVRFPITPVERLTGPTRNGRYWLVTLVGVGWFAWGALVAAFAVQQDHS